MKDFYTLLNVPKTLPSPLGKEVYEWDYFDETGKLKHAKENVQEKIQSYKDSTDYKALIKRGELLENDTNDIYMDTTELGGDFADLSEYVSNVKEHVDQLKEQCSANDTRASSNVEKATHVAEVGSQGFKAQGESGQIDKQSNGGNE